MAWTDPISGYCERVGPGFCAEPANAFTNLAFVVAAIALWRLQARVQFRGTPVPADLRLLPPLVFLVGLGSLLFHTLATRWAGLLDTFLILLFCCAFVYSFLSHTVAAPARIAVAAAAAFAFISYCASHALPPATLNGSVGYLPNLIGLVAMTAYLARRRAPAWRAFAWASALFCISLGLRTIDLEVCPRFPLGTHFLWHLCNAVLLWLVSRQMILRRYQPEQSLH